MISVKRMTRLTQHTLIALVAGISLWGAGLAEVAAFELTLHQTTTGGIDRTPFWLQSNRWGLYTDSPIQGSLGVEGSLDYDFGRNWNVEALLDVDRFMDDEGTDVRLRYGYGALSWRAFEIKGGTFPQIIGILPEPELSSGSMSVSGNARPLPMVQFSIPDWTVIPYTNDTLEIMGGIAHGWFLGDRPVNDTLLHQKWGYARFGARDGSKIHVGLVHNAQWGGDVQDVTLANYRTIFLGGMGPEQDGGGQAGPEGNSLGIWDIGLEMPLERATVSFYHHHYWELKHSLRWNNAFDGVRGLAVDFRHDRWWPDTFVIESIFTKYQGGPYHFLSQILDDAGITQEPVNSPTPNEGLQNYYSHHIYRPGWTHQGRIIGTPLFVTHGEGENMRIASNRVNSWHYAFSGDVGDRYRYSLKVTQATHSPTIIGARVYAPVSLVPEGERYHQWTMYAGAEIDRIFAENLALTFGFGADFGDVYRDVVGFELGLRWKLLDTTAARDERLTPR
ncbi:MAG: hypothetical protein PF508_05700 [Spirochaeta sp.]|jgi:hypothetical protein|nr:hypothetical protein [Spirochaeta sp.]